jgi:Putative esterase
MITSRPTMVVFAALLSAAVIPDALAQNLLAGANTTNPSAPFYIDLTGLDFRTNPPTRNPLNPNYPNATALPDGVLPAVRANGNFIIGPTHLAAPETVAKNGLLTGKVYSFVMHSKDSTIYHNGHVRVEPFFDYINFYGQTAPGDFSTMLVPNCFTPDVKYCGEVGTWTRVVKVYVPRQASGEPVPFIISGDGNGPTSGPVAQYTLEPVLFPTIDNLIQLRRIPPMVAITVENGGQDAQGSQRGFEYDSINGLYAEFVETEVLPLVEQVAGIRLTRNPAGRIAMGQSASGGGAFTMAWFHPELFGKVLSYSPTFTNQQWPHDPNLPGGGWQYHSPYAGPQPSPLLETQGLSLDGPRTSTQPAGSPLILTGPKKPIRIWFEMGDQDGWYPNPMADGMHDYVLAAENMAKVLAAKEYEYQFIFARNAVHVDQATRAQTLPRAIEYLMQGYRADDQDSKFR